MSKINDIEKWVKRHITSDAKSGGCSLGGLQAKLLSDAGVVASTSEIESVLRSKGYKKSGSTYLVRYK